jgi:hypothetical protein
VYGLAVVAVLAFARNLRARLEAGTLVLVAQSFPFAPIRSVLMVFLLCQGIFPALTKKKNHRDTCASGVMWGFQGPPFSCPPRSRNYFDVSFVCQGGKDALTNKGDTKALGIGAAREEGQSVFR